MVVRANQKAGIMAVKLFTDEHLFGPKFQTKQRIQHHFDLSSRQRNYHPYRYRIAQHREIMLANSTKSGSANKYHDEDVHERCSDSLQSMLDDLLI